MERRVIITVAVVFIILCAIVIGTVVYLKNSTDQNTRVISSNPGQMIVNSPSPILPSTGRTQGSTTVQTKNYSGSGFNMVYPMSWGILTCSNSKNIEFDPSGSDMTGVVCDSSLKPITVIVGQNSCQGGTSLTLGRNSVIKTKDTLPDGYIKYHWCVIGEVPLDITERVSQNGERATSKIDYSTDVEGLISNIYFGGAS